MAWEQWAGSLGGVVEAVGLALLLGPWVGREVAAWSPDVAGAVTLEREVSRAVFCLACTWVLFPPIPDSCGDRKQEWDGPSST